jgi:MFS family permease
MFQSVNRNNRLFMLGNFLFALSYGLWMNLRQIHLLDLGASPAEIGNVFALVSIAGGLLPLPAGILSDRIGPKRVIIASWLVAAAGTLTATLAQTWPLASAGFIIFMLCIAANPATVSYVLLNTTDLERESSAEGVMATVFASWPAAMIFAPALGGLIAERLSIQVDFWIGVAGLLAAVGIFALAGDTQPKTVTERLTLELLAGNRQFLKLAAFFPLALAAFYLGYALAPTFLEDTRGFSTSFIGLLFSLSSVGALLFRSVVIKFKPRLSFAILVSAICLGTAGLWHARGTAWNSLSFLLLGAISTSWVVMQASIGRSVAEPLRGMALGITESLYFIGIALASWLAGQFYGLTATHDLPLILGSLAMLVILALWTAIPLNEQSSSAKRKVQSVAN